ncbi:hypothetical protein [Streptomyces osmaniensis]|uniref:Uncharacterized protein n=1 Tax=Streptomyces osmaniensis TaxID=593134 RepID=A0ABP6YY26_9ACTN|nr:hypothetical protein KJK32_46615 [Streptomyces sp. JCM17656]
MTEQPQAGARVRIVIEDTIESRSGDGDWVTTGGITLTGVTPANATTAILQPGWEPGDVVSDGRETLRRIRCQDGVELWERDNGRYVYDDETSLADLTVIHRASLPAEARMTMTITHTPDPPELQQAIARLRREWRGGPQ